MTTFLNHDMITPLDFIERVRQPIRSRCIQYYHQDNKITCNKKRKRVKTEKE